MAVSVSEHYVCTVYLFKCTWYRTSFESSILFPSQGRVVANILTEWLTSCILLLMVSVGTEPGTVSSSKILNRPPGRLRRGCCCKAAYVTHVTLHLIEFLVLWWSRTYLSGSWLMAEFRHHGDTVFRLDDQKKCYVVSVQSNHYNGFLLDIWVKK